MVTTETLKLLHKAFNEALRRSHNLIEAEENLYKIVDDEMEFNESDVKVIDGFLDGVRGSINERMLTFEITNIITYINITLMYIIRWMNSTREHKIDISLDSRRKGLSSELTKLLKKSASGEFSSYIVRDRFGLRGIIWNKDSEEENIQIIDEIFENIIGIICAKNRKSRKEFLTWIEENSKILLIDKNIIAYILGIPFGIEAVKDYIRSPKENGYKTLQFTLSVQMYSDTLPGLKFEMQFRTKEMDDQAENGTASHKFYKKTDVGELEDVFTVDDFSKINIPGFTKTTDFDAIGKEGKIIVRRRSSATLVY